MSIQVVLNVWEQFEVQNLDIFGLQWILVAHFFFIQCLLPIIFIEKVVYTSLVCVVKILYQFKNLWVIESILVDGGSAIDVFFTTFFIALDISKQFCKHNESIE